MADGILKLCGEPSVPGLALPKAFESLEKHIETATNLCKLKGSHESQVAGLLIVCGELQRLLRLAFVENGILASRIEMLSCYQDDFIKRCEKRIKGFDTEQKVTRRYLKKLRRRQSNYETVRKAKGKDKDKWEVDVECSDYDTVYSLSRMSGNPNLEFMLRVNQLLLDFVKDHDSNELSLPPMGSEERAELSKLASLYKLRCRFNKSTQVASSTIIKARQTSLPAPGEIDNLLNTFTKRVKDGDTANVGSPKGEPEKDEVCIPQILTNPSSSSTTSLSTETPPLPTQPAKENPKDEGPINRSDAAIPAYMLTPVSSIGTPTITLEGGEPTLSSVQAMPKETGFKSGQEESLSESPLPSGLLHPQMRTPKVDPTAGAQHSIFKLLPEALDPGSVTTTTTRGLSSSSKSQPILPTSLSTTYTNLYPTTSTSLSSPSALQMALLMQSQQLRALSAAAAAVTGGQGTPLPVSTAPVTPPTSGRSTVLATPLPLSLSNPSKPASGGVKREGEGPSGGAGSGKRTKTTRRSYISDQK